MYDESIGRHETTMYLLAKDDSIWLKVIPPPVFDHDRLDIFFHVWRQFIVWSIDTAELFLETKEWSDTVHTAKTCGQSSRTYTFVMVSVVLKYENMSGQLVHGGLCKICGGQ